VIDENGIIQPANYPFDPYTDSDWTACWQTALFALVTQFHSTYAGKPERSLMAFSTVLLCDAVGGPSTHRCYTTMPVEQP